MSYLFDSYAKIYDHFMRLFHLDDTSVIEHKLSKGQYHILDVGGGSGTTDSIKSQLWILVYQCLKKLKRKTLM